MSKKTTTTKSKPASKTSSKPAPDAAANDKARADALATLNAKAPMAKDATKRASKASTTSAPKSATKTTAKLKPKHLSALDAAAQVLQGLPAKDARVGLSASELIERMAAAGLWTSPSGKTPAATLYAAMTREILAKGDAARFVRLEATDGGKRGRFTASSVAASDTRKDSTAKVQTRAQSQKTSTQEPESRKGAA